MRSGWVVLIVVFAFGYFAGARWPQKAQMLGLA